MVKGDSGSLCDLRWAVVCRLVQGLWVGGPVAVALVAPPLVREHHRGCHPPVRSASVGRGWGVAGLASAQCRVGPVGVVLVIKGRHGAGHPPVGWIVVASAMDFVVGVVEVALDRVGCCRCL